MRFTHYSETKKISGKLIALIVGLVLVVAVVVVAGLVRNSYEQNLQPVSDESRSQVVTIAPGATTAEIADELLAKGVIRSDWAFEWYVRTQDLRSALKAGTYVVDQNQSVQEIVNVIVEGKVATDLLTILPGKRLAETRQDLINEGFAPSEVDAALDPALYDGHPALTDKPTEASLEGYLYPETFQKTAETTAKEIVTKSLDEMDRRLTPELRQAVNKQGLTLHQAIILASIIEGEVSTPEDKAKVSQVFQKRMKEGIKLESNATDEYAEIDPAYDTYKIAALPPGPITNVGENSLRAVAFPAQTDWLYFVSGDDGQTHFSKTLEEHEALIEKYCTTLCGR